MLFFFAKLRKIYRATKWQPDFLPFKVGSPTITTRFHGKVNPIDVRLLLYQQLIEILVVQV
jgi:hypothetical protein